MWIEVKKASLWKHVCPWTENHVWRDQARNIKRAGTIELPPLDKDPLLGALQKDGAGNLLVGKMIKNFGPDSYNRIFLLFDPALD